MIKIKSGEQTYEIVFKHGSDTEGTINGKPFDLDIISTGSNSYHLIKEYVSYKIKVGTDEYGKQEIEISGKKYSPEIVNEFDTLLKEMGMDNTQTQTVKEVKAPMPGLVVDVLVAIGTEVLKDDNLLILEAMKMENMIKSPSEGVVKAIKIKKGAAVEKNEILIVFE